jgi:hypothetical protein
MEPINGQERTNATIRFMVLFFVTMLVVVIAVFFDQIVGNKSNADNGQNFKRCMEQLSSNDQFTNRLTQISAQLSKLNKADNDFAYGQSLSELNAELTLFKSENAKLDTASAQYKQNLKIHNILSDFGQAYDKLNAEKSKLRADYDKVARELDDCKEEVRDLEKSMATRSAGE